MQASNPADAGALKEESHHVLGLFAKQPLPGQVKTRLAVASSAEWATRVATAFLLDMVDKLEVLPVRRMLAFAPEDARPYFMNVVEDRFVLIPQVHGDLGERMTAFFTDRFEEGAERVVLLGTDSPTVPLSFIEQAFQELEQADVVLGPATDGGYYLIGCSRKLPPIFEGIVWSSPRVLADTVARLAAPDWRLALLPPWYDVDTLEDWRFLKGHLAALRKSGHVIDVPRTAALAGPE